jgi:hypothetical protein
MRKVIAGAALVGLVWSTVSSARAAGVPTGGGSFSVSSVVQASGQGCPGYDISAASFEGVLQRQGQHLDMAFTDDLSVVGTSCPSAGAETGTVSSTTFRGGGACIITTAYAATGGYEDCGPDSYRIGSAIVTGTYSRLGTATQMNLTAIVTFCHWGGTCPTADPPLNIVVAGTLTPTGPGTTGVWQSSEP